MKLQYSSMWVLLAKVAVTLPFLEERDACSTNDLNLPSKGMHGYNGISWGFAPDDDDNTKITTINGNTGKKASTYGRYSQINNPTSYDGSQLLAVLPDVRASGAVFVPAIMPTGLTFSQVDENIAQQIASVLENFTEQGIEVWLRFAHEFNYYVTPKATPHYPGGTQAEFIAAWKRVHAAVANNSKVLMFWSPNEATSNDLQSWWPGPNYVDIVGIDWYPKDSTATFASVYGDFYNAFAMRYNKHFCIGETGFNEGSISDKETWVKQLANTDVSAFPCYKSATWFEYNKDGDDFRIIQGQSAVTIKQTLSNFA